MPDCSAELTAYNNAFALLAQANSNVEAAVAVAQTAGLLVQSTWAAYQQCLGGGEAGGGPGGIDLPRGAAGDKPKRKRKR